MAKDDVYGFSDYDDPDMMREYEVPNDETGDLKRRLDENFDDDELLDDDMQI